MRKTENAEARGSQLSLWEEQVFYSVTSQYPAQAQLWLLSRRLTEGSAIDILEVGRYLTELEGISQPCLQFRYVTTAKLRTEIAGI